MYKILSIDGGGIRGIIPARVLERLETHRPGIVQEFDLYAGSSTGAVLAAGFAYGFDPRFMRQMYQGFGKEVFADSIWDDLRDLKYILGADYSIDNMKALLERVIGETTLGDLEKKVLIATFDLKDESRDPPRWKPKFFHNYPDSRGVSTFPFRFVLSTFPFCCTVIFPHLPGIYRWRSQCNKPFYVCIGTGL